MGDSTDGRIIFYILEREIVLLERDRQGGQALPCNRHGKAYVRLIVKTKKVGAYAGMDQIFHYDDLLNVRTNCSGLYHNLVPKNARIYAGQVLAEIIDPCTGEILETVYSPTDGVVFFRYDDPLIYAYTSAFKILREDE